jgi:pimeloyl-ACP methyl ester carboxylesterase
MTTRSVSLASACREFATFLRPSQTVALDALLAEAPRGDGHAVLLLPASLRGDPYTAGVRRLLSALGYVPYGWELGVNRGPTAHLLQGVASRLAELSQLHGPLSIVGFSMGGLFARWLGQRTPTQVRRVITVCSPFSDPASSLFVPVDRLLRLWPGVDLRGLAEEVARPLPVPGSYLFSRDDGVVAWEHCCDPSPDAENIEITGPHVLIAQNAQVLSIVARVLARPATQPPVPLFRA